MTGMASLSREGLRATSQTCATKYEVSWELPVLPRTEGVRGGDCDALPSRPTTPEAQRSKNGGGCGIRTREKVYPSTRLAGGRTRPLCEPSAEDVPVRTNSIYLHTP
jgi:hypothetical protein